MIPSTRRDPRGDRDSRRLTASFGHSRHAHYAKERPLNSPVVPHAPATKTVFDEQTTIEAPARLTACVILCTAGCIAKSSSKRL